MRVLAVDDNPDNLISLNAMLKAYLPECETSTAASGIEGIDKACLFQPDVILLDIQMPVMDGFQVCREIKNNPSTSNIPVIFLTAQSTDTASRIHGLEIGGDAYLTKPVDPGELIAQIKAMVRIKQAEDKLRQKNLSLERLVAERTAKLTTEAKNLDVIFESSPIGMILLDEDLNIIRLNSTALKLSYASSGNMKRCGNLLRCIHSFEDPQGCGYSSSCHLCQLFNNIKSVIAGSTALHGNEVSIESIRDNISKIIWFRISVERIQLNGHGHLIIAFDDITANKKAEEALQNKEREIRTLAENLPDVVSRFDRQFRHLYINNVIEDKTGIPASFFIGKTNRDLGFHEEMILLWEEKLQQVFMSGKPETIEFDFPSPDKKRYFESQLIPEFGSDGTVHTVLTIARDVTDHKFLEDEREAHLKLLQLLNDTRDFQNLMTKICKYLQELTNCDAVGIRLRNELDFPYFETLGFSAEFVQLENSLYIGNFNYQNSSDSVGNPVLECMCGNILQRRFDPSLPFFTPFGSFWTNSTSILLSETSEKDRQARTRNRCNGEGYESVALIPLQVGKEIIGLIQLNDRSTNHLPLSMIHLVERLSGNIAIALAELKAEDALHKSEEKFEKAFHISPDAININRFQDGTYIEINEGFTELTGYTKEEVIGRSSMPHDLNIWINVEDRKKLTDGLIKNREVVGLEAPFRCKDGSIRICLLSARIIEIQGEECILSITRDITERKQFEEKLEKSRDFYLTILEEFPAMIWRAGTDANIDYLNNTWLQFTGNTAEQEYGNGWMKGLHPDDANLMIDTYLHSFYNHKAFDLTYRHRRFDGEYRWIENRAQPFVDISGNFAGYIGICTDVSDHLMIEEQLRQSIKMESVGRLAGGIAHDFNNILTGIIGLTQIALKDNTHKPDTAQDLTDVLELADRAANLTKQLLSFSRRQPVTLKTVPINTIVDNIHKMLSRLIGENIDITFNASSDAGKVCVDISQLEVALINIATNARDAMPKGGSLVIETSYVNIDEDYAKLHIGLPPGDYVRLCITDSGEGMDEETMRHIFEPFYTTKDVGKGTGLGLASVYGIINKHNGSIQVSSELGIGTVFTIYLPRYETIDNQEKAVPQIIETQLQGTILVVEDESSVRKVIRRILESSGYTVYTSESPIDALENYLYHAPENTISMLLTDVIMPDMNGVELHRRFMEVHPTMKVLFISGYSGDTLPKSFETQSNALLQKPFTRNDLLQKVNTILKNTD